jgi:hypothetical protein
MQFMCVPLTDGAVVNQIRPLTGQEMMDAYSVPPILVQACATSLSDELAISNLLFSSLPFAAADIIAQPALDVIFSQKHDPDDDQIITPFAVLFNNKPVPGPADWSSDYALDQDCSFMLENVNSTWTVAMARKVHTVYRQHLIQGSVTVLNNRLCVSQSVDGQGALLVLIIVPESLREVMFTTYHASPIAGHMGR